MMNRVKFFERANELVMRKLDNYINENVYDGCFLTNCYLVDEIVTEDLYNSDYTEKEYFLMLSIVETVIDVELKLRGWEQWDESKFEYHCYSDKKVITISAPARLYRNNDFNITDEDEDEE